MKDQAYLNYIPARQNEDNKTLTHLSAHGISVPFNGFSHKTYLDRDSISCMTVSFCGKYLFFGEGNILKMLHTNQKKIVRIFQHNNWVTSIALSPDDKFLFAGCSDRSVQVWDMEKFKKINTINPMDGYKYYPKIHYTIHFDRSGKCDLIFAVIHLQTGNHVIEVWNYSTGEVRQICKWVRKNYSDIAVSPVGQFLLLPEMNHVMLIDVQTGKQIRSFHTETLHSEVAFSPNGENFLICSDKAVIRNIKTGNIIKTFEMKDSKGYRAAAFSPDGCRFLTVTGNNKVSLWDIQRGRAIKQLEKKGGIWISNAVFSPCGKRVIFKNPKELFVWNFNSTNTDILYYKKNKTHKIEGVEFLNKEKSAFIGGNKSIRLLDLNTGKMIKKSDPQENKIVAFALSPDDRYLIVLIGYGTAILTDTQTGEIIKKFNPVFDGGKTADFSFNSKFLSIGLNDQIVIWSIKTGRIVKEIDCGASIRSVAFTPCGNYLFTGSSDKIVRIWDIDKGRAIRLIHCDLEITKFQFINDGKLVLMRNVRVSRIYETNTYRSIGHYDLYIQGNIPSCALSPSGKYVLTTDKKGIGTLYNIVSGKAVKSFKTGNRKITAVYFVPNCRTIAFRHDDEHRISFWDLDTTKLLATFYSLQNGFFWITPPDKVAEHGWTWTDRPELITVSRSNDFSVLGESDEHRKIYIDTYNRQDMVMNRLNNYEEYQKEISRILNKRKQKKNQTSIDMRLNQIKRIEQKVRIQK